ncbi:CcoQ/FixQ family Cbb3-type cytochrome c oxidase assembly chaperone [Formosa undariae]|uniref:CcoQ/FixQ family Cbb3-type cytochrome c oxidase assembly chaperone n=1 Tax=Formosa undariae TaxID=1325436 RepID=A0ABV5F3T0_9FLAO
MFSFVKNYMDSMDGIAIYPILSLLIFFGFFVILFWWVLTAKKDYIDTVSQIPFEKDNHQNETTL